MPDVTHAEQRTRITFLDHQGSPRISLAWSVYWCMRLFLLRYSTLLFFFFFLNFMGFPFGHFSMSLKGIKGCLKDQNTKPKKLWNCKLASSTVGQRCPGKQATGYVESEMLCLQSDYTIRTSDKLSQDCGLCSYQCCCGHHNL